VALHALAPSAASRPSALAALNQAAELIPNQAILIDTIPLPEARDSSEIESIVTTTGLLFPFAQRLAWGHAISGGADAPLKPSAAGRRVREGKRPPPSAW
jgi:hypothetical protein